MPTKKTKKTTTAARKTVAKKTPAKKTVVKKTPAKKTATTKTLAKKTPTTKTPSKKPEPVSDLAAQIVGRFTEIGGWRGPLLAKLRALIFEADPEILEERKWIKPSNPHGVPTYSHGGLILTLEVYKASVKVTFAQGSKVDDPAGLFNASLLGLRRAIDLHEGVVVDDTAFKTLVRAAVDLNIDKKKTRA